MPLPHWIKIIWLRWPTALCRLWFIFSMFFNTWQTCLNFKHTWYKWITHFHCSPPVCLSPFPAVSVGAVVISTFCFLLLSDDWDELRNRKQMGLFIARNPQSIIICSPRLHWGVWCLSAHSFGLMNHKFEDGGLVFSLVPFFIITEQIYHDRWTQTKFNSFCPVPVGCASRQPLAKKLCQLY